jgi:hypothetical protein
MEHLIQGKLKSKISEIFKEYSNSIFVNRKVPIVTITLLYEDKPIVITFDNILKLRDMLGCEFNLSVNFKDRIEYSNETIEEAEVNTYIQFDPSESLWSDIEES